MEFFWYFCKFYGTFWYYRLLQATKGYYRLLQVTQVATWYYRLLQGTSGYCSLPFLLLFLEIEMGNIIQFLIKTTALTTIIEACVLNEINSTISGSCK